MDEDDPQFRLEMHPAFSKTVPMPMAILNYAQLGLREGPAMLMVCLLIYTVMQQQIRLSSVAKLMRVDRRTITTWLNKLIDAGLVSVPRFVNGRQTTNVYDLNHLLDKLHDNQNNEEPTALIERLATLITGEHETALLDELRKAFARVDRTIQGGVDRTIHPPLGPTSGRVDRTIPPIIDDDVHHYINDEEATSSSMMIVPSEQDLLARLAGIGFTARDGQWLLWNGAKQGLRLGDVWLWIDYIEERDNIHSPAGFLRAKVMAGERPPSTAVANATKPGCNHPKHVFSDGQCLLCAGIVKG